MKEYLSRLPVLSRPEKEEVLFAYVTVASHVVSLVLVRIENGVQKLVYYVSKSLQEAEVRYLPLEKAIFCHSACNEEAPSLFLSAYYCNLDPTPFAIITSKVQLYRKNCQMGDDFMSI